MKRQPSVHVLDYGSGNLGSVINAFRFCGAACHVASDPEVIRNARCIVVPGVGSFSSAMRVLDSSGLSDALKESTTTGLTKVFGICLGLQILLESGTEGGVANGLGLVPGSVVPMAYPIKDGSGPQSIHIGFNKVSPDSEFSLFDGLAPGADFYFAHSFWLKDCGFDMLKAMCYYNFDFVAAYQYENITGVQFHPEKSQTNGLKIIKNFLASSVC